MMFILFVSTILHLTSAALQPNDIDEGNYDSLACNDPDICTRVCRDGERPRVCYYKFFLENYNTLGWACGNCPEVQEDCYKPQCVAADGFERAILTVNRRLPGPSIQVCKGDTIVVDLNNMLKGGATTIHWHGILQTHTPWMDGVPMVTQCPVVEGQTFRYVFPAEDAGTFWYHAHSGLQRQDGLAGGLIIRQPDSKELLRRYYDYDLPSHQVLIGDWKHFTTYDMDPGLIKRHYLEDASQTYFLINGRGIDPFNGGAPQAPLTVFRVKSGNRYRFRFIGATGLSCLCRISVEGHRLRLIYIDKNPVDPIFVDSINISSGERYDVVICADKPVASYQIKITGVPPCPNATQIAILQYDNATITDTTPPPNSNITGVLLNPEASPCTYDMLSEKVCVSQLSSVLPTPLAVRQREPDVRLVLDFGFYFPTMEELFETNTYQEFFVPIDDPVISLINNISFRLPPSPLLTQLEDVPPERICDSCDEYPYCACTFLIKLPLNAVVEILMVDTIDSRPHKLTHPFHIHGYDFYIVEQGLMGNMTLREVEAKLFQPRVIRNYLPMKDTIIVPNNGYTVARIYTDNPGFWFYHCHFDFHLAFGMAAVFQVGSPRNMIPPPENFPQCSEFLPPVRGLYD